MRFFTPFVTCYYGIKLLCHFLSGTVIFLGITFKIKFFKLLIFHNFLMLLFIDILIKIYKNRKSENLFNKIAKSE